jgi:xylulose-5-phosphate/fructose-6-phosphate phosphoketolase
MHAYGAAFDNPDLIVACVIGDGEAETGPLATGWHSNKFLNPAHDGAVLPILHLNGYKIASPTILARIPPEELEALFRGYGYTPYFVEGSDPQLVHQAMAGTLDRVVADIRRIQARARNEGSTERPAWPLIVLKTPKGWTGPKTVDGLAPKESIRCSIKSLLLPVSCRRQLFELSDDMATKLDVEFYQDARDALLKALAE